MAAPVYVEPVDVKKSLSMELEALEKRIKVLRDRLDEMGDGPQ
jgi:hypothetical protein